MMVGAVSLSRMEPVPVTPPMTKGTVSVASVMLSSTVGRVTVKLVTPAGTVILPVAAL